MPASKAITGPSLKAFFRDFVLAHNQPEIDRSDSVKSLWRNVTKIQARERVQPSFGRIYQHGRQSYENYFAEDPKKNVYCLLDSGVTVEISTPIAQTTHWNIPIDGIVEFLANCDTATIGEVGVELQNRGALASVLSKVQSAVRTASGVDPTQISGGAIGLRGMVRTMLASAQVAIPRAEPSFITNAHRLDQQGQTDYALDIIYETVDELLHQGRFDYVDLALQGTTVEDFSVDLLLGLLTSTLPAKSKLKFRGEFLVEVERVLRNRGEYDDSLLTGLQ